MDPDLWYSHEARVADFSIQRKWSNSWKMVRMNVCKKPFKNFMDAPLKMSLQSSKFQFDCSFRLYLSLAY